MLSAHNEAQWLSWLERRPVTAEVESSSLFWVVSLIRIWEKGRQLDICRSGGTGRRPGLKIPWVVIPVPVRFRSAALVKRERNIKFTAFLLFFCSKKVERLMKKSPVFEKQGGRLSSCWYSANNGVWLLSRYAPLNERLNPTAVLGRMEQAGACRTSIKSLLC